MAKLGRLKAPKFGAFRRPSFAKWTTLLAFENDKFRCCVFLPVFRVAEG
eukprot:SAG22_NODE_7405_length_742_cov_165.241058_1_plen_48_part_10